MCCPMPENVMQANAAQPNSFMSFIEKSPLKKLSNKQKASA